MSGTVAYVLEGATMHALTFRVEDLPDGTVACLKCGKFMTREEWAMGELCTGQEENA